MSRLKISKQIRNVSSKIKSRLVDTIWVGNTVLGLSDLYLGGHPEQAKARWRERSKVVACENFPVCAGRNPAKLIPSALPNTSPVVSPSPSSSGLPVWLRAVARFSSSLRGFATQVPGSDGASARVSHP
jgi:hypothetical protein